ncbi:hypothetical protein P153DRAFT_388292 [Dothidotthia symphoricarpi CBS 119687]|uniref:Rhodopsin domain-containing protein n=1 Tax=Dothidotthia symphoricarpi CBS 119687 TaxID=1392245 RepID=A0A6A6A6Z5_9PLEO|nr:uncharacterized protein P153DRAFT_388292 [Dothidotthia symphoricarpi CBS 119687]KAF2126975.1 hypothetical protein P153DRAFT_388292 [Dothidotthia symphoricarpi CBS 119687]
MSGSTYKDVFSQFQLPGISYAMITLSSIFVLTCAGMQMWNHKRWEMQDFLLYLAFFLFLVMAMLYMTIFPKIYMIDKVERVIALPIKLVWNLQMARGQKITVIILFASGFVCIVVATLRVAQIGINAGISASPSPSWLAIWTMVETPIAVCIGCCLAFAVLYRTVCTTNILYDTQGHVRQPHSRSGTN